MFKIAIDAGHYGNTPGKRLPKALDPDRTREWTLNDRVARYCAEAAKGYGDVEVLRVDDPTGRKNVSLSARCKAANKWGADVYISCHHNAGIKLGTGGGIVAYCRKKGTQADACRNAIYAACIAAGGLKGNRANPTPEKDFYVLKHTKMPAVLMEYGFMDSRTDVPVILTEDYAKRMGYATMEGIAMKAGLKKKSAIEKLTVDGRWGTATTTRLQQIFGTTPDGKISNQHKKYKDSNPGLTSGWQWQDRPNGKGSALLREMQKWAGMSGSAVDGAFGPVTCKAIQQKLGTTPDGKVSDPSQMVRALQRWANRKQGGL